MCLLLLYLCLRPLLQFSKLLPNLPFFRFKLGLSLHINSSTHPYIYTSYNHTTYLPFVRYLSSISVFIVYTLLPLGHRVMLSLISSSKSD